MICFLLSDTYKYILKQLVLTWKPSLPSYTCFSHKCVVFIGGKTMSAFPLYANFCVHPLDPQQRSVYKGKVDTILFVLLAFLHMHISHVYLNVLSIFPYLFLLDFVITIIKYNFDVVYHLKDLLIKNISLSLLRILLLCTC